MSEHSPVWMRIASDIEVFRASLRVRERCRALGFGATQLDLIAVTVLELGRNICKYAGHGRICFAPARGPRGEVGIELIALDQGPGIADPDRALQNHYSTGGTLGIGLPAVRRIMDELEIESSPGKGTRVTGRKWL